MAVKRFRAEELIQFGKGVFVQADFPDRQAQAASMILVEADLRGDHAHGIAGGNTLPHYIDKVYDDVFKSKFWVAPLGGTYFSYKGFGLNMLIELDNVVGEGVPGLIRVLDGHGKPTTPERVSQTIEAYAIDVICPLKEAKKNLRRSVETTLQCGNNLMYLPGQKEHEQRKKYLANGIPMSAERIRLLKKTASDPKINISFSLSPI